MRQEAMRAYLRHLDFEHDFRCAVLGDVARKPNDLVGANNGATCSGLNRSRGSFRKLFAIQRQNSAETSNIPWSRNYRPASTGNSEICSTICSFPTAIARPSEHVWRRVLRLQRGGQARVLPQPQGRAAGAAQGWQSHPAAVGKAQDPAWCIAHGCLLGAIPFMLAAGTNGFRCR